MKALVTGASGFIGTALLDLLDRRGHRVTALSRRNPPQRPTSAAAWLKIQSLANTHWEPLLEGIDVVYHLAWSTVPHSSNADPIGDATDNLLGTLRLLEAVRRIGKVRFVFPSSGGTVYGKLSIIPVEEGHATRPTCAYGVSKLAVEKYLAFYTQLGWLDGVALRISNPFGPYQMPSRGFGVIATFMARAMKNEPITMFGDGSVVRDFLFIDDVAEAIVTAGEASGGYDVYNIGYGVGHSLNDVVTELEFQLGRSLSVKYTAERDFDVPISVLDISRARAQLRWAPRVSFRDGIGATLRHLMARAETGNSA
jgi:UDP-glucose 4-epimerase